MRFLANDLPEGRGTGTRGHKMLRTSLPLRSKRTDWNLPAIQALTSNTFSFVPSARIRSSLRSQ